MHKMYNFRLQFHPFLKHRQISLILHLRSPYVSVNLVEPSDGSNKLYRCCVLVVVTSQLSNLWVVNALLRFISCSCEGVGTFLGKLTVTALHHAHRFVSLCINL